MKIYCDQKTFSKLKMHLTKYIFLGNSEIVTLLLENDPSLSSIVSGFEFTPLHTGTLIFSTIIQDKRLEFSGIS